MLTHQCEPCLKGKQMHAEIRKTTEIRADTVPWPCVLQCLWTHVHALTAGFLYFVTFTDRLRCVHVVGMKEKPEVERHLKAFITRAELETGLTVKVPEG
jgi:hypothetical protein